MAATTTQSHGEKRKLSEEDAIIPPEDVDLAPSSPVRPNPVYNYTTNEYGEICDVYCGPDPTDFKEAPKYEPEYSYSHSSRSPSPAYRPGWECVCHSIPKAFFPEFKESHICKWKEDFYNAPDLNASTPENRMALSMVLAKVSHFGDSIKDAITTEKNNLVEFKKLPMITGEEPLAICQMEEAIAAMEETLDKVCSFEHELMNMVQWF